MEQPRDEYGTRRDLAAYRIETSKSNLKSARILLTYFSDFLRNPLRFTNTYVIIITRDILI